MYNQPYFIPGYFTYTAPSMMRGAMGRSLGGAMGRSFGRAMGNTINGARLATQGASKGLGLFSRLSNSMRSIKGINWGGLITNTSKTLNVVNQAIPLVRQVGPMVNNMKSMLRIASIFKDETDNKLVQKTKNINSSYNNMQNNSINLENSIKTNKRESSDYNNFIQDDNSPTFFINS